MLHQLVANYVYVPSEYNGFLEIFDENSCLVHLKTTLLQQWQLTKTVMLYYYCISTLYISR